MRKLSLLPLLFVTLLFISCDEQFSSIGLNLRDRDELLGTTFMDTSSLVAFSMLDDSISTKKLSNNVLGFVNDPTFGSTKASYYAQYLPSENGVDFGTNPVLDSVVLCIRVGGFFGDTLTPLPVKVYELNRSLYTDSTYTNSSTVEHKGVNLTYNPNFTVQPTPQTRVYIDTNSYDAHIRIRLTDQIGQMFLDNESKMVDAATFVQFFKGLYVTVENPKGTGSLMYINLTSTLSNISIYYKKNGLPKRFPLVTNSSAVRFNNFEHNYNNGSTHFVNEVINRDPQDPTVGTEILYAQASAGVKTKISFPFIKETFKNQNVVINRAELVITNISTDEDYFFIPALLSLQCMSKTSGLSFLPDDAYNTSSEYFGATYIVSSKQYRIRITKYIQQLILNDDFENYIYLLVSGAGVRGNRLIMGGVDPSDPNIRLRLEISYTKY